MYDPDMNAPPINSLPVVIILLVCLIGGAELVFQMGENGFVGGSQGIGWRIEAMQRFAFSDTLFDWMRLTGTYSPQNMLRFISYIFVHQSFMHTLFALVFVLAIGKFVAEIMHPVAVFVVFFASAALGAAIYSIILDEQFAMIGSYPAVYGLIGSFTWLRFSSLQEDENSGLRAFNLIVFFMAIALIYKFLFGGTNDWLAELSGFCVGFLLSIAFGPDSKLRLQKMLSLTRQR